VSAESTGTTTPEREQTAPTAATHTQEKKYWTIARDSIAPSISTRFYDWTDRGGTVSHKQPFYKILTNGQTEALVPVNFTYRIKRSFLII
jgi:hypothetical protein